ncbi:MAG: zinc ribbon domain-containing protein [Terracidiphilus sp.]
MASFCAKCGAALSTGEQFCKSCGTAAVASAQPTAVQPTAAPAKSGGGAVKIILIIVAVIVGLGILAMGAIGYVGWRVSRAIHVNGPNGQMTLQTPEGKVNLNTSETYTAAELGTDLYPGAQSTRGGMKMDLPTGSMVTAVFLTSDSKDQVIAFYKNKFGSETSVFESADNAVITLNKSQQEAVVVTITTNSSEDHGKTRITITHTKSTKAS